MYWWVFIKKNMETFQLWTFSHSGHTSFFTWCFAAANAAKGQPRCWGQALWLLASPGCCVLPGEPIWWAPGEGDDGCFLIIQLTGNKRIFNISKWFIDDCFLIIHLGSQFFLIGWWCGNNSWQLKSVRPCSIGVLLWRRHIQRLRSSHGRIMH